MRHHLTLTLTAAMLAGSVLAQTSGSSASGSSTTGSSTSGSSASSTTGAGAATGSSVSGASTSAGSTGAGSTSGSSTSAGSTSAGSTSGGSTSAGSTAGGQKQTSQPGAVCALGSSLFNAVSVGNAGGGASGGSASAGSASGGSTSAGSTAGSSAGAAAAGGSSTSGVTADDVCFINLAARSGLFEIRSSQLAVKQAKAAGVKSYATMMIKEHTAVGQQLSQLASSLKSPAPTNLVGSLTGVITALQGQKAATFDRSYLQAQVASHQATVKLFQTYLSTKGNAKLRALASQTLPKIEQHLAEARKLGQQAGQGQ